MGVCLGVYGLVSRYVWCVCIASQIKLILHTPGKPCRILPSVGRSVGP